MIRLLFVVAIAALVAVALTSVHAALTRHETPDPLVTQSKEPAMPAALKNLSFALLLALLFGIVTGWIGG